MKSLYAEAAEAGFAQPQSFLRWLVKKSKTHDNASTHGSFPKAPPLKVLQNFIQNMRAKSGQSKPTPADLIAWADKHSPDTVDMGDESTWDTPFVLKCQVDLLTTPGTPVITIVITTIRLLCKNGGSANGKPDCREQICVDSTYKVTWNDLNVAVVISVDFDRKTQPLAIAIMSGETQEDYRCVARSITEYEPLLRPSFCMTDFAGAISNGLNAVFEGIFRGKCQPHLSRVCNKALALFTEI
jgi:hypothetical protein